MKLAKISIENFKGIGSQKTIILNDFNVIVGQNDVGKSTILKALDCFFNNKPPTSEDLNKHAETSHISITLHFTPNNLPIIIDENIPTTFEEEELVNNKNELIIKKVWDVSKSKITAETFLLRKKYDANDFLPFNEKQLIKKCNELGIETQKANGEEYNNKEKRQKLREYNRNDEIQYNYEYQKLPTSGSSRFKIIHDSLKKSLPRFEYFKADTSLSETDNTIQKFFKTLAIRTIEKEVNIDDFQETIRKKLQSVLDKITSKINQVVPEDEKVSADITFDWNKLVSTSFKSKKDDFNIPLSSRGDGFRRITMMAYFEYLAEQQATEHQDIIFGFEEPETFLHPSGQENLFSKLFALTENHYQVIITTHSPIIVANTKKKNLIHIFKENGNYSISQHIEDISFIAKDLGINVDNQFVSLFDKAKALLLVEGIDDANAFHYLSAKYKENGLIDETFEELGIAIIPIGGCNSIKHWVSLNLLQQLNKPFLIFQDSDKTSQDDISPNKETLVQMGFIENEDFFISKKRNLENYILPDALNRIAPGAELNYNDWDNVKQICKRHSLAGKLGGKNVVDKHFQKLTFEELRLAFFDGEEDEFLNIYNKLKEKLSNA